MTLAQSAERYRNRRRRNYARIALRLSLLVLAGVCAAAVLFSPHLWVRVVQVEGVQTLPARRVVERMGLQRRTNIVSLPAARMQRAVEQEPVVASATLRRLLPDYLLVSVRERQPWAVVKAGAVCYTVDHTLVPFRKERMPEKGLPLIVWETLTQPEVRLGKRIVSPDLAAATTCLLWAARQRNFPLSKIVVDRTGKLCLNRTGGAEIRLGSGMDLDKKLNVLALLLERRTDLKGGNVAYVNLYAYDAPAILPRPASESSSQE